MRTAIAVALFVACGDMGQASEFDPLVPERVEEKTDHASYSAAELGRTLFVRETAGNYAWRRRRQKGDPQSLTLSTDVLHALHRLRTRGVGAPLTATRHTLQGVFEQDPVSGEYRLVRSELGLFTKRLWLIHEPARSAHEDASISVRVRFSW